MTREIRRKKNNNDIISSESMSWISLKVWRSLPECQKKRARMICEAINQGESYHHLGGKKLRNNQNLIRFRLGQRYRLVGIAHQGRICRFKIMSHEDYNTFHRVCDVSVVEE